MVETCSVTAADCSCLVLPYIERTGQDLRPAVGGLFSFPLKIHFKSRQLPAGWKFSQNFFCFCNAGNRILATGGAENFSFHSPHHRVLKFAKRNGKFSLCFLLRAKIKNAKRRGRKIFLSLTTTTGKEQNGRERSRATKKQQIFFRLTAFAGRRWRLVFSFEVWRQISSTNFDLYAFFEKI